MTAHDEAEPNAPAELPERKEETDDTPLSFDSPESSLIERAEYDPGSRQCVVRLRQDERRPRSQQTLVYTYDLPLNRWMEWVQAPSKGGYFTRHIRPLYAGTPFGGERRK